MFILFQQDKIRAFKSCGALSGYIRHLEREGKENWVFARYSYQRLASFYRYIRSRKLSAMSMGAIAMEESAKPDVLEILTGDAKKPRFLSVTSGLDVAALQEKWCRSYCKAHGYALFKVSSPANFNRLEEQGGGDGEARG